MIMIMPAEFERKMREISEIDDSETKHIKADELMCEVLKSLGYEVGVEIFEKMRKWYA